MNPPQIRFVSDDVPIVPRGDRGKRQRPHDPGVSIWSDAGAVTTADLPDFVMRRRRSHPTLEPAP